MTGSLSAAKVKEFSEAEEVGGKLQANHLGQKLMNSVMGNDKSVIKDGKIIQDSINQGMGSFNPDLMFEQLVNSYSIAERLYGKRLLKALAGYEPGYIRNNLRIPEFRRHLKDKLQKKFSELRRKDLVDRDGSVSETGLELAALTYYYEELSRLMPSGVIGRRFHKKPSVYGARQDMSLFKKGAKYRDIALKGSIKLAIRRAHKRLRENDLKVYERKSRGEVSVIYALDASASMRGKKIEMCKRAGVALSYSATENKDKVGLIVFGSQVREEIAPTDNFTLLLKSIVRIRAGTQTDFAKSILKSVELFPGDASKHLMLITDAIPTAGKNPEKETLEAVSIARGRGITVSVIGINLDSDGEIIAKKIVDIGQGRLYSAKNLKNIDKIVLEDYYSASIWQR
ncbi:MAG: VWA domain-containing protein [archaeon]